MRKKKTNAESSQSARGGVAMLAFAHFLILQHRHSGGSTIPDLSTDVGDELVNASGKLHALRSMC